MQSNFLSTLKSKIPYLTWKNKNKQRAVTLTTGNSALVIVFFFKQKQLLLSFINIQIGILPLVKPVGNSFLSLFIQNWIKGIS